MTSDMKVVPDPTVEPERLEPERRTGGLPSAGRRLRQAREALGLSQTDVSARLHLTPQLVDALERDDLEQGPGPMYMRGYVRTYARLLDIPAEEILATLPVNAAPTKWESISTASPPPKVRAQARMSDWPVRWVTYIIGAVLVGLTLIWLWGTRPITDDLADGATPIAAEGGGQSLSLPAAPAAGPAPETALPLPAAPAPVVVPAAPVVASAPQPAEEPPAVTAAAEPPAMPAEEAPAPAASPTLLRLAFSEDCWVRVESASGALLKNTLMRAGQSAEFTDGAPYSLVLGNARAVSVEYAGRPVNLEAVTRKGIARLTVGGEG